jgi:superfamily II DNA or RNA helicase
MTIQVGDIVKNLVPQEPVCIQEIKAQGSVYTLRFMGMQSRQVSTKIVPAAGLQNLHIVGREDAFNFEGDPQKFKLYAEAERILSAFQFDPLFAVNCSIVDPLPHQVEAVYRYLLPLPRIRFLLADDTGAGKTIMTGLLLKELIFRRQTERILIVTPGGLTRQWQEDELALKFNLDFTLLNRNLFLAQPNIFHTASRLITSIDFISREEILQVAGQTHWDLVVFDEAHKLSAYEYGKRSYFSRRYKAAAKLAKQCEHLLLLTATPHRGRSDTFKMLLQLLDEDIFSTEQTSAARIREVESGGVNRFFIRRLKENMQDWEGAPLYKNRYTRTVAYELSPSEMELYQDVTRYLTRQREEAYKAQNVHVSLALTIMQRRLASSVFALKNTLEKRYHTLSGIAQELQKNPDLWNRRGKLELFDIQSLEDWEELDDAEREALENILLDPKKFKLFTTAQNIEQIQQEAWELKELYQKAEALYAQHYEEQKFVELRNLLRAHNVVSGEKLVIFTEHKDTLFYLQERLANNGYKISTIHGGLNLEERRRAQTQFLSDQAQILIATDAAGEGVNLQKCRLLINWDIPWNPNRLEQRMGRIHRYGQTQDVLVFNMVAANTVEGKALERLLRKLDAIREGLGDDRVYDVIQDVLSNVSLNDIFSATLEGQSNKFTDFLEEPAEVWRQKFSEEIQRQKNALPLGAVDYAYARELKAKSDEGRLQPIYIRVFFENAFKALGGNIQEKQPGLYELTAYPPPLTEFLRRRRQFYLDSLRGQLCCFEKPAFWRHFSQQGSASPLLYMNPGSPIYDGLLQTVLALFQEEMVKGAVLISPSDKTPYFAYLVRSQICDARPPEDGKIENVVLRHLACIEYRPSAQSYSSVSPAKFIDLYPPSAFGESIAPPPLHPKEDAAGWCLERVTLPLLEETLAQTRADIQKRIEYTESAFAQIILEVQAEINALQAQALRGELKNSEKLNKKEELYHSLLQKKKERLSRLELMMQLYPKEPEILGCVYVFPLSNMTFESHFGMKRDDEAEAVAMQVALAYEKANGWEPQDVSRDNLGYDICSVSPEHIKRYIEVKGRSGEDGAVMLSENEMNRLSQLGASAWLYIALCCKTAPRLFRIQNPAACLDFQKIARGFQYLLPHESWAEKAAAE